MDVSIELIALLFGIGAFFTVLCVFAFLHAYNSKNMKSGNTDFFADWEEQVYDALFARKRIEDVGSSFGIDVRSYTHSCHLLHKEPNPKKVIVYRLCGFVIIAICVIIGLIAANPIIMVLGLAMAFPFIALPLHFIETETAERKFQVAEELPRFLDMLYTALLIELPVEQAIEMTARSLKGTVLAEELLNTLAQTKVGAASWQEALEQLAADYGIDTLSDFVLDITNSYNLGSSILDSVARKSHDIKQTNLMNMKERASKLTNTILLPIMLFKMIPILAIMLIPIVIQLESSGF